MVAVLVMMMIMMVMVMMMLIADSDDPEYLRQSMRPVEVKEDVRQMEERKRVKLVLHSRAFRDELEELVIEQLSGSSSANVSGSLSLQQLSDFAQPRVQSSTTGRGMIDAVIAT